MPYKGAIFAAYNRIDAPTHAQKAWQLFKPYLHNRSFAEHLSHILQHEQSAANLNALSAIDLLIEAHDLTLPPPGHTTAIADLNLNGGSTLLKVLPVGPNALNLPLCSAQAFFLFGVRLDNDIWNTSYLCRKVLLDLPGKEDKLTCVPGDDQALAVQVHMLDLIECILESKRGVSH
jgi:hypothetical protein